jgi:glycosyltransferase involved in cell wall biosynthesis
MVFKSDGADVDSFWVGVRNYSPFMVDISIIIPCYNYAHYLPASLDSILNQDYPNYEVILVDDGSSDETWEIMKRYAAKHPHVKAFKHATNQGLFKANKKGWEEARGKYLHFFSADDLYHPSCLHKVMHLFKENPHLGLVCTDIAYFEECSKKTIEKKLLTTCKHPRLFSRREMIPMFQSTNFWIPGLTCVVKQETLKKYGHLDPKLENISDWFCFHKIALFEGVGYIPETLISMRLHDQTYTSRVKRDKKRRRATYHYLLQHLNENKELREPFKTSGLLTFIFRELYWKLRFNPRYLSFWRYIKDK